MDDKIKKVLEKIILESHYIKEDLENEVIDISTARSFYTAMDTIVKIIGEVYEIDTKKYLIKYLI